MELIPDDAPERRAFGRMLLGTSATGFVAMLGALAAYLAGWVPARIPVERMPEVWSRSAADHLRQEGLTQGWSWVQHVGQGDFMALLPIAWLATCSGIALAAVLTVYLRRKDGIYAALCLLQLAILSLAASGFFALRI